MPLTMGELHGSLGLIDKIYVPERRSVPGSARALAFI
jgi:hypothetical protein